MTRMFLKEEQDGHTPGWARRHSRRKAQVEPARSCCPFTKHLGTHPAEQAGHSISCCPHPTRIPRPNAAGSGACAKTPAFPFHLLKRFCWKPTACFFIPTGRSRSLPASQPAAAGVVLPGSAFYRPPHSGSVAPQTPLLVGPGFSPAQPRGSSSSAAPFCSPSPHRPAYSAQILHSGLEAPLTKLLRKTLWPVPS